MLLREGVPVGDRERILEAFVAADSAGDSGTPLVALRAVRRALGPDVLGVTTGTAVHALPETLERRIAEGVAGPDGARWEADRETTARLVGDLRDWLAGLTPGELGEQAVVVHDPAVRPFAWRLLARERPRVRVLAQEERR
jgi:flagellar biosynthesis component FlhA